MKTLPPLPLADVTALCRKYHVRELSLFGSAARGEMRDESDLDFLVEFDPQARVGLITLAGLTRELEDLLHISVDVVPKDSLKSTIQAQVFAEAQVIKNVSGDCPPLGGRGMTPCRR